MGKDNRPKNEAPRPNSVTNREIYQRMNFLYQASSYLKSIEAVTASNNEVDGHEPTQKQKRRRIAVGDLGSSYVRSMRAVGNKSVTKMDPNVKRTLCGSCDTVLLPGVTASVRVKGTSGRSNKVLYTCLSCDASRAIPAPPVGSSSSFTSVPTIPNETTTSIATPGLTVSADTDATMSSKKTKRIRAKKPRPLPLFARPDAGHIVYIGNEPDKESNL
ncbi:hypothetical protein M422DRAFT_174598 [Sphaerobolus stellatus SS14]|uniref:Rpr2-domain-containing protein n=1 Tax=Sphaerobolus stellatus (strain SS14) TaxID=990650 RepID=A0A0C9VER4_SPHS4|nr:hypothetical protein M422DRAFT_174598 [Sphaerobolus stellatus SS14]